MTSKGLHTELSLLPNGIHETLVEADVLAGKKYQKYIQQRVERYRNDPDYRQSIREYTNKRSHDRLLADNGTVRNSKDNLSTLSSFGKTREIAAPFFCGEQKICFMINEVAQALGDYTPQTVRSWISKGFLPEPLFVAYKDITIYNKGATVKRPVKVYLYEELFPLMYIFAEHQQFSLHLREHHKDVIREIHQCLSTIREDLQG